MKQAIRRDFPIDEGFEREDVITFIHEKGKSEPKSLRFFHHCSFRSKLLFSLLGFKNGAGQNVQGFLKAGFLYDRFQKNSRPKKLNVRKNIQGRFKGKNSTFLGFFEAQVKNPKEKLFIERSLVGFLCL